MKRIQRKRTKGWKMPDNSIYVGRPTKFGNPFKLTPEKAILYYKKDKIIGSPWCYLNELSQFSMFTILVLYEQWIRGELQYNDIERALPNPPDIEELRGKDLACWCSLDKPCHVDVLIKLLNP